MEFPSGAQPSLEAVDEIFAELLSPRLAWLERHVVDALDELTTDTVGRRLAFVLGATPDTETFEAFVAAISAELLVAAENLPDPEIVGRRVAEAVLRRLRQIAAVIKILLDLEPKGLTLAENPRPNVLADPLASFPGLLAFERVIQGLGRATPIAVGLRLVAHGLLPLGEHPSLFHEARRALVQRLLPEVERVSELDPGALVMRPELLPRLRRIREALDALAALTNLDSLAIMAEQKRREADDWDTIGNEAEADEARKHADDYEFMRASPELRRMLKDAGEQGL